MTPIMKKPVRWIFVVVLAVLFVAIPVMTLSVPGTAQAQEADDKAPARKKKAFGAKLGKKGGANDKGKGKGKGKGKDQTTDNCRKQGKMWCGAFTPPKCMTNAACNKAKKEKAAKDAAAAANSAGENKGGANGKEAFDKWFKEKMNPIILDADKKAREKYWWWFVGLTGGAILANVGFFFWIRRREDLQDRCLTALAKAQGIDLPRRTPPTPPPTAPTPPPLPPPGS